MFGLSVNNQTSKELVTGLRLQDRECATIAKLRQIPLAEELPSWAVLVERVGVLDDYALYSVYDYIDGFNAGTEVKVLVEFWQEVQVISYLGQNIKFLLLLCNYWD